MQEEKRGEVCSGRHDGDGLRMDTAGIVRYDKSEVAEMRMRENSR